MRMQWKQDWQTEQLWGILYLLKRFEKVINDFVVTLRHLSLFALCSKFLK
jgi:hypothetical protein